MRFGRPARILAAAGVLTLALVGLVVRESIAREQGTEVRLALAGYDPRSLLQGHYVLFRLSEDVPGRDCPPGTQGRAAAKTDWVALTPTGTRHRAAGAASSREQAARLGEVTVRGRLMCGPSIRTLAGRVAAAAVASSAETTAPATPDAMTISLDLGVDRIHLSQAEAEAVEAELRRPMPDGQPPGYAVLSIGRDGKARVKGVIVGQRRVDLDWF